MKRSGRCASASAGTLGTPIAAGCGSARPPRECARAARARRWPVRATSALTSRSHCALAAWSRTRCPAPRWRAPAPRGRRLEAALHAASSVRRDGLGARGGVESAPAERAPRRRAARRSSSPSRPRPTTRASCQPRLAPASRASAASRAGAVARRRVDLPARLQAERRASCRAASQVPSGRGWRSRWRRATAAAPRRRDVRAVASAMRAPALASVGLTRCAGVDQARA